MTQLFGDHVVVANATGCSSIYGGNLPTTPYTVNAQGRGPVWSNSLFEDNAEFGLGLRLAMNKQEEYARHLVQRLEASNGRVSSLVCFPHQARADQLSPGDKVTGTFFHQLSMTAASAELFVSEPMFNCASTF